MVGVVDTLMSTTRYRPRPAHLLAALLYFTVEGVLRFGYKYFDVLAREGDKHRLEPFLEEVTGSYGTGLLLFVLVIPLTLRFRVRRGRWRRPLLVHGLGALVFSALHTSWMALTRAAIFPLTELGRYDYGLMAFRYPMEAFNDVVSYAWMVLVVHLLAGFVESRQEAVRTAQLEAQLERARLDILRMQIHPHFLFNTLNAISSHLYRDPAAADRMLARLADLLRLTLEQSDQCVELEREADLVRLYLEMMALRFPDRLRFEIDVAPELGSAQVPSLILQPLVENAVEHAVRRSADPSTVIVRATREAELLSLEVLDEGGEEGAAARPPRGRRGLGLETTRSRLGQLYGGEATLEIAPRHPRGTRVTVRLPLRERRADEHSPTPAPTISAERRCAS